MTRISDQEGSLFDAPIEVVWRFLQSPDAHGTSHKGQRNRSVSPTSDTSFVVSWEQNMNGNWVKVANRITLFPPLGMASEAIEGPLAGSRVFTVYTPKGDKTEVSVFGDMHSKLVPESQLEPTVRGAWERAYNDDAEAIRNFAGQA